MLVGVAALQGSERPAKLGQPHSRRVGAGRRGGAECRGQLTLEVAPALGRAGHVLGVEPQLGVELFEGLQVGVELLGQLPDVRLT